MSTCYCRWTHAVNTADNRATITFAAIFVATLEAPIGGRLIALTRFHKSWNNSQSRCVNVVILMPPRSRKWVACRVGECDVPRSRGRRDAGCCNAWFIARVFCFPAKRNVLPFIITRSEINTSGTPVCSRISRARPLCIRNDTMNVRVNGRVSCPWISGPFEELIRKKLNFRLLFYLRQRNRKV